MYWTLELASKFEDAPWPATKEGLIDDTFGSAARGARKTIFSSMRRNIEFRKRQSDTPVRFSDRTGVSDCSRTNSLSGPQCADYV